MGLIASCIKRLGFSNKTFILLGLLLIGLFPTPAACDSAVVLVYHRFGEDNFPLTNITIEQFEAHISELKNGDFTIMSLPDIINRQRSGERLPSRTVGISIDDAYQSIYDEAWPRLKDAGFPFTLFVSTDPIDAGYDGVMSWNQIREMQKDGVTIGAHTSSHLHMNFQSPKRLYNELNHSNNRFKEELGDIPTLFAYPYGETSLTIETIVKETGYVAAFGQHSGAFSGDDNPFNLPRFPMNEKYGNIGRFKTAINSLALSVIDITPLDSLISNENPPAMGFTLKNDMPRKNDLSCFLSHAGKAEVELLGNVRFEVRVKTPFLPGRTRLNCTMPGDGENAGRWYWFGRQFYLGK